MRVRPSGAAFFSASAASWPLAPGLLSTTTDVPSEVLHPVDDEPGNDVGRAAGRKAIKIRTGPSYAPAAAVMARPRTASSARSYDAKALRSSRRVFPTTGNLAHNLIPVPDLLEA